MNNLRITIIDQGTATFVFSNIHLFDTPDHSILKTINAGPEVAGVA